MDVHGLQKGYVEFQGLVLSRNSSSIAEENHASEKTLIRKVDLRLLPILGALYAISLVDRVNVFFFPHEGGISLNLQRWPMLGSEAWARICVWT
jgi:hypothetical protein